MWRVAEFSIGNDRRLATATLALAAAVSVLLLSPRTGVAQADSQELKRDFPKLFDRLSEKNLKADYVIVIDRSGSMDNYWEPVREGIKDFVEAIREGDRFSIVTFANSETTATAGCVRDLPMPSRLIDSDQVKMDLKKDIDRLCNPDGASTDIGEAMQKTLKELNLPGGNTLKIVFFFTDFIHTPPASSPYANRYSGTEAVWLALANQRRNELSEKIVFSFAILLDTGKNTGHDLKLAKAVFPDLEQVRVNTTTIREYVTRLRNEILRDRLKALVKDSESHEITVASIYLKGNQLVALLQVKGDSPLTEESISDVEASEFQAGDLSAHLIPAPKDDKEYSVDAATGRVEVPIANIRSDALLAWEGSPKISFTLKGARTFSPGNEIKKLNLPVRTSFELSHKQVSPFISGGRFTLSFLVVGAGVLIAMGLMVRRKYRQGYLYGTVTIRNSENDEIGTEHLASSKKRTEWRIGNLGPNVDGYSIEGVSWSLSFFSSKPRPFGAKRGTYLRIDEGEVVLTMNGGQARLKAYDAAKRINGQVSILADDYTVVFCP